MKKDKYESINLLVSKGDFLLAIGIIGVLAGLILPLPAFLIDVLLAFNVGVAMVIVMVSTFVEKPLQFSVFPSMLLFTALLRIAMNVATTRKILLEGYAGEIIMAFGQFVVGGNYIVGVIIFIILLVIQMKVITAGSSRISEVAARFTLDAMPGKQMTIDADLNSGLITEEEAREKREELSKEADFYGAMDGASKFVRGDVTAGMIITAVNIVGGLILGMLYRDMGFNEAVAKYTLLTVGDGLVSQIPSLVISTAAGIIVTRAGSASSSLGKEMIGQMVFYPKATLIGSISLFVAGLVPNMPMFPFWLIGSCWLGMSWWVNNTQKEQIKKDEDEKDVSTKKKMTGPEPVDQLLQMDVMGLEIGYGLIPMVDASQGGDLLERINAIRKQFALEQGLVVPPIRIRDNMELNANEYVFKIKENDVARGEVMPEFYLAMNSSGLKHELVGVKTKEPAFGLPATWVNDPERRRAESLGFTVVDATTVLATHMKETIRKFSYEILSRQDVQGMIDNLKKNYPAVIEDVVPTKISVGQIHRVLQNLLREQVSIRNLMTIFEVIGDYASIIKDIEVLGEYVRSHLKTEISRKHANSNNEIHAVSLIHSVEKMITESLHKSELGTHILLEPSVKSQLIEKLLAAISKSSKIGIQAVLLVSPGIRLYLKKLIEKDLPHLPVLSYSEISDLVTVKSIEVIKLGVEKTNVA